MNFYHWIRPILFTLPPEIAHRLTIHSLHLLGGFFSSPQPDDYLLSVNMMGHKFSNPFGLAAGFDKNAEIVPTILNFGFGFTEIGTVTPLPQSGNPKPRIFRLSQDEAIINRLGFNSHGQEVVYNRLIRNKPSGIVGINIGANKDSENHIDDYQKGAEKFANIADYLVINVSSPNTAQLRGLQKGKSLITIIENVTKSAPNTPILLKISPDLEEKTKYEIAEIASHYALAGLIIANTTVERTNISTVHTPYEEGGLSGKPLMKRSTQMLADMYKIMRGKIPLIGVGGITNAQDAYQKIRSGATLIQLYSALIYQGPFLIYNLKNNLVKLLRRDGFTSIADAIGIDVDISTPTLQISPPQKKKKKMAISPQNKQHNVTIYHNPRCSKSRQTLAILQEYNTKIKIITYLTNPPRVEDMIRLLKKLKISPHELIRKNEKMYKTLQLNAHHSDDSLVQAMVENPILIERPIVVKGQKAIIGRPPENVHQFFT